LTFALAVGILEMASESFQDPLFGPILVGATVTNLLLGFCIIGADLLTAVFPDTSEVIVKQLAVNTTTRKETIRKSMVAPITPKQKTEGGDKIQFATTEDTSRPPGIAHSPVEIDGGSAGIPGPRASRIEVRSEEAVHRKPARLTRKSTARRAEDIF
jgi:hypothetical protein